MYIPCYYLITFVETLRNPTAMIAPIMKYAGYHLFPRRAASIPAKIKIKPPPIQRPNITSLKDFTFVPPFNQWMYAVHTLIMFSEPDSGQKKRDAL